MKNIAVFAFFVSVLIVPAAVFSVPSFLAGYTASLEFNTGFLYGHAEESVYFPNGGGKQSRLDWDMKPLFYSGAVLDFSRIDPLERAGFFVSLFLKFGIPAVTGVMEDRDWNEAGLFTDFSRHDNRTEGACLLDGLIGFSVPFRSRMVFSIYGAVSWIRFRWAGQDGYGQYLRDVGYDPSVPIHSLPKKPYTGTIITYSQDWLLFYPGAAVLLPLSSFFSLKLSFQGSPFVYCAARDNHITTGTEYRDRILWGLYLEPGTELNFTFYRRCALSLSVSYRMMEGDRGTTWMRSTGYGQNSFFTELATQSGAAVHVLNAGLSFKIRLQ
ncbi:MAG: omptin family outer membrane protease [Treponema sp.]|jgi:outer membrane protease|nr:omptin family outer membrane protease [Treponema sp.]